MSRPEKIDLGTPETRARLASAPCPWQRWPDHLKQAALSIDVATRLVAGRCLCRTQPDPDHIGRPGLPELTEPQRRIVRDYRGWEAQMRALGWSSKRVIDVIVHGEPCDDPMGLRLALGLYAKGTIAL